MLWTPSILPPHPSTVPSISPLAESVLALIRKGEAGDGGRGTSSTESSYMVTPLETRTRLDGLSPGLNAEQTRRENFTAANYNNAQYIIDTNPSIEYAEQCPSNNADYFASSCQNVFNQEPYPTTLEEERFASSSWLDSNYQKIQQFPNNRQFEPAAGSGGFDVESMRRRKVHFQEPGLQEPFIRTSRSTVETRHFGRLSPAMEFDEMDVYSLPTNEEGMNTKNTVDKKSRPYVDVRFRIPLTTTTNNLNFKEIKRRPLQKIGIPMTSKLGSAAPSNNFGIRKMEPSDQTFVITDKNIKPKFKNVLEKFKRPNSTMQNKDISNYMMEKNNPEILQSNLQNKSECKEKGCNEIKEKTKIANQELPNRIENEKENCEKDRGFNYIFEKATSKFNQEHLDAGTLVEKKFQKDVNHLHKLVVDKDTNFSSQLSEQSEGLFVKTQESVKLVQDQIQQNAHSLGNSTVTKDNNFIHQSALEENLLVKNREGVIIKSDNISQSRVIESNPLSEELSLLPYQKPQESDASPEFEVDDLFSLQDESSRESLDGLSKNVELPQTVRPPPKTYFSELVKNGTSYDQFKRANCINSKLDKSFAGVGFLNSVDSESNKIHSTTNNNNFQNSKSKADVILFGGGNQKNTIENCLIKSVYFSAPDRVQISNHGFKDSNKVAETYLDKILKTSTTRVTARGQQTHTEAGSHNSKSLMGVDVGIGCGSLTTKSVNKKTNLKQTTLFDCRKFNTEHSKEEPQEPLSNRDNKDARTPFEIDTFKKPLPPPKKGKTVKTKCTKENNTQQRPVKTHQLNNSVCRGQSKTNKSEIEFLKRNTPLQEIKQKCDPSRMVQTSLIKNEPVKRSLASPVRKTKKPCFVPPIAASHLTSQETSLKNYTITVLDEASAKEVLQRLKSDSLSKVVATVTFKEGYTLLNKPGDQKKNSRCFPSGVMFLVQWESGKQNYYLLHLLDEASITSSVKILVYNFMSKPNRIICFEAQAVYMLLLDILHYEDISSWNAYDPLVGCWLLDPDNPPRDFQETSVKLEIDKSLLAVNPKANTKTQACDLLPVLDVAMDILQKRLVNASLWMVFSDMETKLIPILAVMESSSIQVDVEKLHKTTVAMDKKLKTLQNDAHQLAERWFQLNSPQQLREILFDKLKLDEKLNVTIKKTEQGAKSTSESVLEQLKEHHPLPKIILEFRRLQKLKSTYVDGLIQHLKNNRTIGTSWEQVAAATGRITSKNPNLQAFPKYPVDIPDGETIHLREIFKAREGCTFLAADFQQIEFRVFAHFTQDKTLLQAFREGGDIFQRLAERWLGGKGEEEREKTKRIVYSVMYGVGANKLSEYLRVEPSDAYKIINNFVNKFPSLRSLPRSVIAQCRMQGHVVTLSGRRRLFPHIRSTNCKLRSSSERQAMNFLIQGSAADICKAAMLDCESEIRSRGLKAKLLLMIHDELVWEVDNRDLQETAKVVRIAMEHRWNERLMLLVPIPVCVSTGKTLADMKSLD